MIFNLNKLRSEIDSLNSTFFKTLSQRRDCARKIQEGKVSHQAVCFDPVREEVIFSLHKDELEKCSIKEILSFSLLMESQAGENYPAWSKRIHLKSFEGKLYEQINPLLLKIIRPLEYQKLELKESYQF